MPSCFSVFCGLAPDEKRAPSTPKAVAKPPPPKPAAAAPTRPKRPATDWRSLPLIKQYVPVKKVGRGGFSEVWLAERVDTHEQVALKVVQLAESELEPDEIQMLIAEAKFLRSLDCPYIIKCFDAAWSDDWLVLVVEYLTGGEMLDHICLIKKYSEATAAKLFAQVVSAISYLHTLNMMHRDLKPENVMFVEPVEAAEAAGRPLRVKVIDLGMAALYDTKKPIIGVVGTPGFLPPEVWADRPHTPACDIYSLGVMLFIMLCGRKPHASRDIRQMIYCLKSILDAPGLQDERYLALSAPARELLLSMMADSPKDRPTCMAVLKHPFIAAVDSNLDAHREMGDAVRRRMRDLARLRRMHGLRYALLSQEVDRHAFLEKLEARRKRAVATLDLHPDASAHERDSNVNGPRERRSSMWKAYATPLGGPAAEGGGAMPETNPAATAGGGAGEGRPSASGYAPAAADARRAVRASGDGGGGGGGGGERPPSQRGTHVDRMVLVGVLPALQKCDTLPAGRGGGGGGGGLLSPVPSCDPAVFGRDGSMYTNSTYNHLLEAAACAGAWSAYPAGYEALEHRDVLLGKASLPKPGTAKPAAGAAAGAPAAPAAQPSANGGGGAAGGDGGGGGAGASGGGSGNGGGAAGAAAAGGAATAVAATESAPKAPLSTAKEDAEGDKEAAGQQ